MQALGVPYFCGLQASAISGNVADVKTLKAIQKELVALWRLKPVGPFSKSTQAKIDLAIEELLHGIDDTAAEFGELTEGEQDVVRHARRWKNGDSKDRPSMRWSGLVA